MADVIAACNGTEAFGLIMGLRAQVALLEAVIDEQKASANPQPTQAQAGAVPLTDAQIDQAIAELGLNYLADAHATNRAVLQKLCRHAHSIKGGQHDV